MYDAIVVGARCAGSPVAMLLARRGYRVLLLDRCAFPSDTFRSHYIQPPGVALLRRWGLLDRVAASGCPPIRTLTSDLGDGPLTGPVAPRDRAAAAYAPRRVVLDAILAEAAAGAGAELRERFSVRELLWEGGRVVGIRGRGRGGGAVAERARVVVGADGLHSLVARAVGAAAYHARPALTFGYYSYFSGVPLGGIEVRLRPGHASIAFPTNAGLTLVAVQAPLAGFPAFRADIGASFFRALEAFPAWAARVRAGRREERWYGAAELPNFFRVPHGAGWALVGDAGYHKDPLGAQGIADAFRDAALLAEALDAGWSGRVPPGEALAAYRRERDAAALPGYEANHAAAALAPPAPEALARRAALRAALQRRAAARRQAPGHGGGEAPPAR